MTSQNTRNDTAAQRWLDRAATTLEQLGEDGLAPSDYIQAAAAIGFGYSQLAHLDDQRANRAEDLDQSRAEGQPDANELFLRVEDALSWIDDPKGATPEQQLAKIRECLEGPRG